MGKLNWFARQSSEIKTLAIQIQEDVSLKRLDEPLKIDNDRITPIIYHMLPRLIC